MTSLDPPRSSPSVDGWDDEGIEQDHDDDLRSIEDADPHSNSDRLGATGLSETENEEGIASSCGDKFKEPEMARVSKDTSDLVSGNYNKPSAMSAIRKVIKMCENHLAVGNVAQSHYRNVCRALVTEAMELSSFLARAWETKDDHNHAELQKLALIDWAQLWIHAVNELRRGVKLKVTHFSYAPIEYALTPYEMLMDDIRSKRYKLNKVAVDGDIPNKVKRDAHDIILDFIRSRPPLKPASRRKLNPPRVKYQTPHELLIQEINSSKAKDCLKKVPPPPSRKLYLPTNWDSSKIFRKREESTAKGQTVVVRRRNRRQVARASSMSFLEPSTLSRQRPLSMSCILQRQQTQQHLKQQRSSLLMSTTSSSVNLIMTSSPDIDEYDNIGCGGDDDDSDGVDGAGYLGGEGPTTHDPAASSSCRMTRRRTLVRPDPGFSSFNPYSSEEDINDCDEGSRRLKVSLGSRRSVRIDDREAAAGPTGSFIRPTASSFKREVMPRFVDDKGEAATGYNASLQSWLDVGSSEERCPPFCNRKSASLMANFKAGGVVEEGQTPSSSGIWSTQGWPPAVSPPAVPPLNRQTFCGAGGFRRQRSSLDRLAAVAAAAASPLSEDDEDEDEGARIRSADVDDVFLGDLRRRLTASLKLSPETFNLTNNIPGGRQPQQLQQGLKRPLQRLIRPQIREPPTNASAAASSLSRLSAEVEQQRLRCRKLDTAVTLTLNDSPLTTCMLGHNRCNSVPRHSTPTSLKTEQHQHHHQVWGQGFPSGLTEGPRRHNQEQQQKPSPKNQHHHRLSASSSYSYDHSNVDQQSRPRSLSMRTAAPTVESPKKSLSLSQEEVAHIRSVLVRAKLEALPLPPGLRSDVEKSKVCFLCMKVRFGVFSWAYKCKVCQHSFCSSCIVKKKIPEGCFKNVPVGALSPNNWLTATAAAAAASKTTPSPTIAFPLSRGTNLRRSNTISASSEPRYLEPRAWSSASMKQQGGTPNNPEQLETQGGGKRKPGNASTSSFLGLGAVGEAYSNGKAAEVGQVNVCLECREVIENMLASVGSSTASPAASSRKASRFKPQHLAFTEEEFDGQLCKEDQNNVDHGGKRERSFASQWEALR